METPVGEAKLPKLVITKFNGTFADWPRFWGQYSETIDKSNVPPVTKFAYLRDLLDAKVRKSVEALPHSAEGYNRAVSILKDRFGKESEIVKAYVKEILELPYTSTGKTKRIHEFFDKLSHSVQSLETLKSLHEVNGMVSLTLEKLRRDLVRNDPDWETWDFVKFTEALRQWTRRNPIDSFKLEDSQSFGNETACSKHSRMGKGHESVFTAKRKFTSRQNALKSPHPQTAKNFWLQKGSVTIGETEN